jgi:hypothetical protein
MALNPGEPMDLFWMSLVCWDLGQSRQARQWYERAAQLMDEKAADHIELRNIRRMIEGIPGLVPSPPAQKVRPTKSGHQGTEGRKWGERESIP